MRSRWKCIVALGSPVVPEVNPSSATSSRPVFTASNFTGLFSATRSSSASWLDVPSKFTTCLRNRLVFAHATSSSAMRLSVSASAISALSIILPSSPARSIGMVLTTTAPALVAASQAATSAGLLPGHRVLIRSGNNPALVAAWLAATKAGAVVVNTMPMLRAGELAKMIDKAEIALALTDSRIADELVACAKTSKFLKQVVNFDGTSNHDAELDRVALNKPVKFDAVKTGRD